MSTLGTADRPLRVGIIGSGPSGFYAADAVMKSDYVVRVDMFDKLPSPFGLVRLGVAPDHPKIKNVIKVYERIAAKPEFNFYGNVNISEDISVADFQTYYDALIFCTGCSSDRRLNIPGEDLPGSHTATSFVAWYNGHPEYRDTEFDFSVETAVIIGQGNVAVDVCRILAKTVDELKETDIAQHALDALAESKIKHIYMIGRRGPVQAKFTQVEIKEMGRLAACDAVIDPADMQFDPISQAEYDNPENKHAGRIVPTMQDIAAQGAGKHSRKLHIQFFKGPAELLGQDRVEGIRLEKNKLEGEPGSAWAAGTGEMEELSCGLVFRSVGYRGLPTPGLPFDDKKGVIANVDGRVLDGNDTVSGIYVAGWIKRGPSGIIGTNKPDSQATVARLLEDIGDLEPCSTPDTDALLTRISQIGKRIVSFDDWQRIDAAEVERGVEIGKPREKFTRIEEMLGILE